MQIMNNVLVHIGRARPTNRTLAWGIGAIDWDGGKIMGNVLAHSGNQEVTNAYGIKLHEHMRNVDVGNNIVFDYDSSQYALGIVGSGSRENIRVFDNELSGTNVEVIRTEYTALGAFFNNVYYSGRDSNSWFSIQGSSLSFSNWTEQASDTGSIAELLPYSDPNRTVESYHESLGGLATIDSFIEEAQKQSKFNWLPEYSAQAVNAYIRDGFRQQ